jgi:predicted transcriptional regulator
MAAFHQLEISEELYRRAREAAEVRGFKSIEEYLADTVREDLEALKTPQWMLDELDKGIADQEAGRTVSLEEANAEFERFRAEWIAKKQA